ncbi:MAG: flagellar basal body P-ring formation chaperone FlgA [Planctomycetota bacterium]|nr:flagellar basal body P-ring formation chaperone FlgA [Planctomycetota bacterium]
MFTIATALAAAWTAPAMGGVRIHLPREIAVSPATLTLGALSVIACDDPEARKALEALPLGPAPGAGEVITVTRALIVSRLASAGLNAADLKITGAAEIAVRLNERLFSPDELLEAAQLLLKSLPPTASGLWQADKKPAPLAAPGGADVQLQARLLAPPAGESVTVRLVATAGKDELARTDVTFRRGHTVRQAVAIKDIPAGVPLTADVIGVEDAPAPRAGATAWLPSPTAVARVAIAKGAVIQPTHVEPAAKGELLVKRGQSVIMRINGDGFSITALAEAMQEGRAGDTIKVLNTDSKRVVIGKIMPDGSIQPKSDEVNR